MRGFHFIGLRKCEEGADTDLINFLTHLHITTDPGCNDRRTNLCIVKIENHFYAFIFMLSIVSNILFVA